MLASTDTVPLSGRAMKFVAVSLVLLALLVPLVTAQSTSYTVDCPYDDIEEALGCAFLGEQDPGLQDDPRMLLFGIVLPFLLVFAILRMGLKKAFNAESEVDIIALVLALFIIPSGGYRYISEFLLAIGGLGSDGFDETQLLAGVEPWQQQILLVGTVAVILSAVLLYKGDNGTLRKHEFMLVGAVSFLVWIAMGGLAYVGLDEATAATGQTLGLVLVGAIGVYLLYIFLRSDSGIDTMAIGFLGLMIVAWVLSSLPEEFGMAQQLGDIMTAGGTALVVGLISAVLIFFVVGATGGGSGHVIAGLLIVIAIMAIVFHALLMLPITVSPQQQAQDAENHNLYKPAAEKVK